MSQAYLYGLIFSGVIGAIWISFGKTFLRLNISFKYSGWFTPIWFLPALVGAVAQIQFTKDWMGLIFLMEAFAAFIAGAFGPLGWMSFHFGLFQGLLGELGFFISKNLYLTVTALILADFVLMLIHPKLSSLKKYSKKHWLLHFLGVLFSSLVLVFLLSLRPNFAEAKETTCEEAIGARISTTNKLLLLVVDFDGSMVDTDAVLIDHTIPSVINSVISEYGLGAHHPLSVLSGYFQRSEIKELPETYSLKSWKKWGFPVGALPFEMGKTERDRLIQFWKSMAVRFEPFFLGQRQIPFLEAFVQLHNWINEEYRDRVEWRVLTSRTKNQARPILDYLNQLGTPVGNFQIIARETGRGEDSQDNADQKIRSLRQLKQKYNLHQMVFLENDAEILRRVSDEMGEDILLLRSNRIQLKPFVK